MTDYEEREKLREIVLAIAPFLDDWQLNDKDNYRGLYLCSPDGKGLYFNFPWNKPDRIEIRGIFPNGLNQYWPYSGEREKTEITVSITKTPKKIAQDIKKRLLPPYERMLTIAKERKQKDDQYDAKRRQTMEMVKEAIGGNVDFVEHREGELYGYKPYSFRAKYCSGDEVEITIRLTLQKAIEALKKI